SDVCSSYLDWQKVQNMHFSQGYLNRDKARTVRIRIAGEQGFLTVKGATSGATRSEFEYEIPLADAKELLLLCDGPIIEKIRHLFRYKNMTWEVDEFLGDNHGLIVAEIELQNEEQVFEKPEWISAEVTHDSRYYNSNLAVNPYSTW